MSDALLEDSSADFLLFRSVSTRCSRSFTLRFNCSMVSFELSIIFSDISNFTFSFANSLLTASLTSLEDLAFHLLSDSKTLALYSFSRWLSWVVKIQSLNASPNPVLSWLFLAKIIFKIVIAVAFRHRMSALFDCFSFTLLGLLLSVSILSVSILSVSILSVSTGGLGGCFLLFEVVSLEESTHSSLSFFWPTWSEIPWFCCSTRAESAITFSSRLLIISVSALLSRYWRSPASLLACSFGR